MKKLLTIILILLIYSLGCYADTVIDAQGEFVLRVKGEKGDKGDPGIAWQVTYRNVREYGAMGNGLTDDTVAFKLAFTDIRVGERIYIPRGHYVISETVVINNSGVEIFGDGVESQVCLVGECDLFHFKGKQDAIVIRDLCLGSTARLEPSSVLFFDNSHRPRIYGLFLRGGYYGIRFKGCLGPYVDSLRYIGYWNFFKRTHLPLKATVYAERGYGYACNNYVFENPYLGQGNIGIWINNEGNSEGSVSISNGCIEAFQEASIRLTSCIQGSRITSVHMEAANSNLELIDSSGVIIESIYNSGSKGVYIQNSDMVNLTGSYVRGICADESSSKITVNNVRYSGSLLGLRSYATTVSNMVNASSPAVGAYGYYVSAGSNYSQNSLCIGDMESWQGDTGDNAEKLPVETLRVVAAGCQVDPDIENPHWGKKSAFISLSGLRNYYGLRYYLNQERFSGRKYTLVIRAWVYKPAEAGVDPAIYVVWGGRGGSGQTFPLEAATWTPITITFYLYEEPPEQPYILFGGYAKAGNFLLDDVQISPE